MSALSNSIFELEIKFTAKIVIKNTLRQPSELDQVKHEIHCLNSIDCA